MNRTRALWPFAALALALAAVFGPAIAQGLLLAPDDGLAQYFPERVMAAEAWRRGEVPFWNPYIFGGMPLLAAMQGGVLYPGNAPFLVLPPVAAMNATVLLAFAVAGAGAYALGRALAMPRAAALVTGLSFMLSGFLVGHLEHVVMVQAAGLIPWVLWAVARHRATGESRYARWGAVFVGLMLLAGHPQIAVYGLAIAAAYGLWAVLGRPALAAPLALMLLLGMGFGLVQLLPTWDLSRLSDRASLGYAQLVEMSLPPRQLATLLFPFLYGAPPAGPFQVPYWGAGPWRNELVGYAGLVPLLLTVAAMPLLKRPGPARFFAGLGLAGLLLALGGFTPLYRLWATVPVLDAFRVPGRHLLEVDLAVAVLAGLGAARLLSLAPSERRRGALWAWAALGLPLVAIAGLLALAGPALAARWQAYAPAGLSLEAVLSPAQPAVWVPLALWAAAGLALWGLGRGARAFAAGAVLVCALDMGLFAAHAGWWASSPRPTALAAMAPMAEARTAALSASAYPYRDLPLLRALGYPVTGSLWGVRAVGGYDPLMPARYSKIMGGVAHSGHLNGAGIWQPGHHGLDLFGARHVVLDAAMPAPPWPAGRFEPLATDALTQRYANHRAMPMAWRPALARVLSPGEVDAGVTADPDLDPRTTVLLETPLTAERVSPGLASVEREGLGRMVVSTRGTGPGVVVVSEGFDPGWHAVLDGRELPVHRAYGLLIGIEVPPGAHRLTLSYEPPLWKAGLAGTGLSLIGWLVWWRRSRRRAAA